MQKIILTRVTYTMSKINACQQIWKAMKASKTLVYYFNFYEILNKVRENPTKAQRALDADLEQYIKAETLNRPSLYSNYNLTTDRKLKDYKPQN